MERIEDTVDVAVPVRVAYNQWTQFESFPRFMQGVTRVEQLDDVHLRWSASIAGLPKYWDATITEQVPDRIVSWQSSGKAVNHGSVTFARLGPSSTRVHLILAYETDTIVEEIGDALGVVKARIHGDLGRFKHFIEARGEPTGAWRGVIESAHAVAVQHAANPIAVRPPRGRRKAKATAKAGAAPGLVDAARTDAEREG